MHRQNERKRSDECDSEERERVCICNAHSNGK
jgi:hypothetical protein